MKQEIRIAGIVGESIVDGPGIRYTLFTQGCKHNCEGCHNPHTHSFDGGRMITIDQVIADMEENPMLDGITLSGGEPFEQAGVLAELAKEVKQKGYNVMTYSGYTYEQLVSRSTQENHWSELLNYTDILVDGRFDKNKKSYKLRFKGSENQRIIDVNKTRLSHEVIQLQL